MSPARVEAVRNAQRAFFQAALAGADVSVAPTAAAVTPATRLGATASGLDGQALPSRPLRPGSLVDIKV